MEKLLFKSLSARYLVRNEYIVETEENYCSVFSCRYKVNALYDEVSGYYNFNINRADVLIDGESVRKLMDKVIFEIGNTIYPLSLTVSPNLQIKDIINYKDIKERWTNCTKNLLQKYPSPQLRRYVSMSEKNIRDIPSLIHSLYKDTFFNVYFRDIYTSTPEDEANAILWVNFPKREMNQTYLYTVNSVAKNKVETFGSILKIVSTQEGHYSMDYELCKTGEIHTITGKVESKYQSKVYQKKISVKMENRPTGSSILPET